MSSSSILEVINLTKKFTVSQGFFCPKQKFIAVDNISFSLNTGEILGFLGPNGAGKTTTIQMLLGILNPTSGIINYLGKNFQTHKAQIAPYLSFASTYVKLPGRLTVWENLDIYARLYGIKNRKEQIEKYLTHFDMLGIKNKQTGVLSAGQMTRVMLAKAFLTKPKVVLLDEPTASLDPDIAYDVRKFILEQQKEFGTSILITSHNMDEVSQICDRVLVLKSGKIIANDTPETLAASIQKAHVHFISDDIGKLEHYAAKHDISYSVEKHTITYNIEEKDISYLLIQLALNQITYNNISIEKPTLEDYFLHIAQKDTND